MPSVTGAASDSTSGQDVEVEIFLSPEEEIRVIRERRQLEDQGASPQLRRSSRKRKSTTAEGMSKGSSSKKKRQAQ